MSSKTEVDKIDATPSKRIYRSIIADYDLNTAICELIDNAIDASGVLNNANGSLAVRVNIDLDQQSISILDDAGGVKEKELKKLISPGDSTIPGDGLTIGIFGVGSKRAVVALAQLVQITTRFQNRTTFRVEYDDEWLHDKSWLLPYYQVEDIAPRTTEIKLSNLRFKIEEQDVQNLRQHLSQTYPHFITTGNIVIRLNEEPIVGRRFDHWAFPPNYAPESFEKRLSTEAGKRSVRFQITGGLTIEGGSIGGDWGVFFYCNKRLIARAIRSPEVGFVSGQAGVPHPRMSLARIIVEFEGPSGDMPWMSNKAHINYNHPVYRGVKRDVIQMVKTFTGLSKSMQPDFETEVLPHTSGEVSVTKLAESVPIKPSYLPKIPPRSINYQDSVIDLNKKLVDEKPWVRGLYEGVVAFDLVAKQQKLEQRNRISLIILDSTLEIAFKDFLAYEIPNPLGDDRLMNIFKDRTQVHAEVAKHLLPGDSIWKKVSYFYRLRCELIHKRANAGISDENIEDFRKVVTKLLYKAFKVRFPDRDA